MAISGIRHILVLFLNAWLAASQGSYQQNKFMIPEITLPHRYRSLTTEEQLFPADVEELNSGYGRNMDSSWYTPMTNQNTFQQYQVTELNFLSTF